MAIRLRRLTTSNAITPARSPLHLDDEAAVELGLRFRMTKLLGDLFGRRAGAHGGHERLDVLMPGEIDHEADIVGSRASQDEPLTGEVVAHGLGVAGAAARRRAICRKPEPSATPARMSARPSRAFRVMFSFRKMTP